MNTLKSVEELLVVKKEPVYTDHLNPLDPLSPLIDVPIYNFGDDDFGVLDYHNHIAVRKITDPNTGKEISLKDKNKVLIAKRYEEQDVRITEFQINNLRSITKVEPREMLCALKGFYLMTINIGPTDSTFSDSDSAGWRLHDDYFVRVSCSSPYAEDTMMYNETILVPKGTRLVPFDEFGVNHQENILATIYHVMMQQLLSLSRRTDGAFVPCLVNMNNFYPNFPNSYQEVDAVGTEVLSENIYDEHDKENVYGMLNAIITDLGIVLVGGYLDISKSVYDVYNNEYKKRRVYDVKVVFEDFDALGKMQPITQVDVPLLTREAVEPIGLGIDLQQIELFNAKNFDNNGTPAFRSVADDERLPFDFKVDADKTYTQYIIQSYNDDHNGENRMYRHPVQWRLLVEYAELKHTDPNGNPAPTPGNQEELAYWDTFHALESLLNSIDKSDVRIKGNEMTTDVSEVVENF